MQYEVDAKGGLLARVDGLWVQWSPVTKIQFERFLCETGDARFDAEWYARLLDLNPRVSPRAVRADNYWQALLSGILPREAESFARWLGEGYRLPSDAEWRRVYAAATKAPAQALDGELPLAALGERDRDLLTQMERVRAGGGRPAEYFLADQMLLRGGVIEWVEDDANPQRWSGRGKPASQFHAVLHLPGDPRPLRLNDPANRRLKQCGFRLVRTES